MEEKKISTDRLKISRFKLDALLDITISINANLPTEDLLSKYESILRKNLGIGKILIFKRSVTWECILNGGFPKHFETIDVERRLLNFSEITYVSSAMGFGGVDIIVPVYNNKVHLAFVFIGDIEEEGEGMSPVLKHLNFIQTISSIIIVAIENIRLFKELSVLDNVRIAHYGQANYSSLEALFHLGRFKKEEAHIIEHSMELLTLLKIEAAADEQAKNLPYGAQRRVEIARALATRPRLLLLDEPAAGMNPKEIDQLMDLIHWIRDEFSLTILLIEHQMHLVMSICERLVVLDFGETIAEGKPEEIQADQRVLEAYLGEAVA